MLGEFKEASHLYQMVAKSCVNSNLRRMNSLDHLLMSILCLMAVPEVVRAEPKVLKTPTKQKGNSGPNTPTTPRADTQAPTTPHGSETASQAASEAAPLYQTKYETLYSMNEQFERIDFLWRRSKEKLFVRNLIRARTEVDLHAYADHLYYWSNVRPINACRTILLKVPMLEIKKIIDDAAKAEAEKKAKEEAAALRRAKKQVKLEATPSMAGSSFQSSEKSSFQDGRTSMGSDGKDNRGSLTKDNTALNARASVEVDASKSRAADGGGGGRSSIQDGRPSMQDGRSSVNSGEGRDSVNMRNSINK